MITQTPKGRTDGKLPGLATEEDVKQLFGDLDGAKVLEIMNLYPTVEDLERASLWLGGDPDVFGAGSPIKGVASNIVTILTADEDDESPAR